MKRSALAVVAALALLIVAIPGGAAGAGNADKSCTTIDLGGPRIFSKHNMNCKSAKKKARQVYASRGANEPRKFNCSSGSGFADGGFCQHVSKNKYFGWHPAD